MASHSGLRVALILLTSVTFVITIIFNALAGGTGVKLGVFLNTTGGISDVFQLEITPAGWTFSVWGVIYTWQALWLVYGLASICRVKNGDYMYQNPVMPPIIYILYIFNLACNVAWLFLWDRQMVGVALPFIALLPVTLYICLFFSFKRLYENLSVLMKQGVCWDIWLIRLLVQNGLAFYAAWVSVATLLNLSMVLHYDWGVSMTNACTVSLSILSFDILLWFVVDNFIFDTYTRYTFSPYVLLVVAISGVFAKNYNLDVTFRNSVFIAVLLALAVTLLVVKITIMVYRHIWRPIMQQGYDFKA